MVDKEKPKRRGRPRAFDRDEALQKAQALFHAHGYEGVGVAALAEAMGVNPPSLYAAFGSKAALYEEVLARYDCAASPMRDLLAPGGDPAAALSAFLREAAATYAADRQAPGCLVLEGSRGVDPDASCRARAFFNNSCNRMRDFVAITHPDKAQVVADYMTAIMSGMSADARAGKTPQQILAVADMAGLAIRAMLGES